MKSSKSLCLAISACIIAFVSPNSMVASRQLTPLAAIFCAAIAGTIRGIKTLAKSGEFYSPSEVAGRLLGLAEKHGCDQFRISGAEPILGKASAQHLAEVIKRVDGHFIIETNGVMLGADQSLIEILELLPNIHVRLCIKAHHGLDFEKITGAKAEGFAYQLLAAESLKKARIEHSIAIMAPFVDPRKLPCQVHEVEELISYRSTERNLRMRGLNLKKA
jgi:uncharacterized Fe-S cluster-containing radical SAM superfamily protein